MRFGRLVVVRAGPLYRPRHGMRMNQRHGARFVKSFVSGRLSRGASARAVAVLAGLSVSGAGWSQDAEPPSAPAPTAPAAVEPVVSPFDGRPVTSIVFEGLSRVTEDYIRNQLRTREGRPFSEEIARADVARLYRLGEFRTVDARAEPAGEGVTLRIIVVEAPIINDIQAVGNRRLNDDEIAQIVSDTRLLAGTPVDEFQVDRAIRAIEERYRSKGYYNVDVTLDQKELADSGIVLFRIREGERIRVTDIRFEGNTSYTARQLRPELNTKTAGVFERGPVDDEVLSRDVAALVTFFRDRGYLDVRADFKITPSPNGKEAIVTFLIEEGPLYTLRTVRLREMEGIPEGTFTSEQIVGLMEIKPGDAFALRDVTRSLEAVRRAYWALGYSEAIVRSDELRDPGAGPGVVDIVLTVSEGPIYKTGEVRIAGNTLTKQKIIRRELQDAGVRPDRLLDRGGVDEAETRLQQTRLFEPGSVKVTIQPENPEFEGYRDVLVEVEETNTGSLSFGAAVGSDSGLSGLINLEQRNFDLLDYPSSFTDFIRGQAFRGAGQNFFISAQPGTEIQTYGIGLTEPRLFETDYSLGGQVFYRLREFDDYDEERYGGRSSVGRRFGDRWVGNVSLRAEWVDLDDIDASAPVDVFEVSDQNLVTGVGVQMTRTTVPVAERFRPTRGTRLELSAEQVGALGGDFDFTRASIEHQIFLAIWEDYFGRKGVLSFKTRAGYIFQEGEAPVYERYYLGGRSFRGFEFRTVSPKGIRNDNGEVGNDPVGGDWLFFFGTEYEHPLWRDVFSVVFFVDSGTVTNDPGFDQYRVSAGTGIRLYIPQLGNAPLAFDFAFPILEESGDEEELFSFSVDLPF